MVYYVDLFGRYVFVVDVDFVVFGFGNVIDVDDLFVFDCYVGSDLWIVLIVENVVVVKYEVVVLCCCE